MNICPSLLSPGSCTMYDTPLEPSFRSSKAISALLGPSTAMLRPPAPASLVQILNSATHDTEAETESATLSKMKHTHTHTNNRATTPTWYSSLCSLQAWPSSTDLMRAALSQWANCELERAARHVHAVVFHTNGVHARLGGDKTNAISVVLSLHDVGLVNLSGRACHLSRHVRYADL